jgi:hypothetical protein
VEIIEGQAVRFTMPSDRVNLITDYIEKSELLKDDGKEAEVLVYWASRRCRG